MVFSALEFFGARLHMKDRWDPRKLPPVRDPNRIKLSTLVGELTVNIMLCTWWLWWAGGNWYPTMVHFAGISVFLAPVWRYFFWGYLLVFMANTAASV